MQFSSSFVIAALPFLITAQPHQIEARDNSTTAYTLTAIHSGDQAVHNQPINAANDAFFIGAKPNSICPTGVTCPAGTDTSVLLTDNSAALNVDVPAGQQIYVASTGALSYTPPHGRGMPSGATSTGFTTDGPSTDDNVANLIINGIGSQGWLACPSDTTDGNTGYQIFANITGVQVPGNNTTDCHGIAIALEPETTAGASAYQYQ